MNNFLDKLNESTNLIAVIVMAAGVVLVLRGHTDSGLIAGAFALMTAASKKSPGPPGPPALPVK